MYYTLSKGSLIFKILGLLIAAVLLAPTAFASEKPERVSAALAWSDQIFQMAKSEPNLPMDAIAKKISPLFANEKDPYTLMYAALMFGAISYPKTAGEDRFDNFYDCAFWACVHRLANLPGPTAHDALQMIADRHGRDGDRLRLEQAIENQAEVNN